MMHCCNGTCPMYDAENGECCATDGPRVSVKPDAECFFDAYERYNPFVPPKPTNADRIRSMNDEELAWFINLSPEMEFEVCLYCANGNTVPDDRGICLRPRGVCVANDRRDAFLEWLKQPVKEEI